MNWQLFSAITILLGLWFFFLALKNPKDTSYHDIEKWNEAMKGMKNKRDEKK